MSNMRNTLRLLEILVPLGLCFGMGLGCSATSAPRTSAADKMKTFLSVGDKPLPVVSGPPGSTVAADDGKGAVVDSGVSARRVRPDGKISGRVFDADGRPLPQAKVRLAVNGTAGGKVVSATTDRAGAFTLHGLRAGANYTVIAEWEGDEGVMTGRAPAKTSDTNIKISLAPQSDDPPARAAAPARVNRVSDREAADEQEPGRLEPAEESDGTVERDRPTTRVNEEDLPPAAEADAEPEKEAMAPSPSRTRAATPSRSRSSNPADWRQASRGGTSAKKANDEEPVSPAPKPSARHTAEPEVAPVDSETRGTAAPADEPVSPLDDGPNPLPPALERVPEKGVSNDLPPDDPQPSESRPPRQLASRSADPDPGTEESPMPTTPLPDALTSTRPPAASSAFESPTHPTEDSSALPPPVDVAPGALVVVPESFAPVVGREADPFAASRLASTRPVVDKTADAPAKPRSTTLAPTRPSPRRPASSRVAKTADPSRRRPKWGEVASVEPKTTAPVVNTTGRNDAPKADPGVARRGFEVAATDPTGVARASQPEKAGFADASCDYDDRLRRIMDFSLPDLEGKTVRFHDIDADLVLIDFWGTWCQPCLRSMPHLVDLQARMGNRLAVVGIACEPDAPEASAAKVSETVRKLKVNYPVLLSRNDGSCPIQQALHISAFPTMILVDRQGRVLWRDQGATSTTLARLDRILASAEKSGGKVSTDH